MRSLSESGQYSLIRLADFTHQTHLPLIDGFVRLSVLLLGTVALGLGGVLSLLHDRL